MEADKRVAFGHRDGENVLSLALKWHILAHTSIHFLTIFGLHT